MNQITNYTGFSPQFNLSNFDIAVAIRNGLNSDNARTKELDSNLLTILPANTWMERAKSQPIPKMLFSEFWFEGEVSILFADTNVGKSILAVQIADSISRGVPIPGFKLEAAAQPVLYYDFELSEKQFENRYSREYEQPYCFDKNFFRAAINPDADLSEGAKTFTELLIESIENSIKNSGAKVLIVDNLTYLSSDNERAKEASPLMQHLKKLKNKYSLSLLVLAHTPKRDESRPLAINDIQGSKMISNFCDSAFAIGKSHVDNDLRYIKQIKERQLSKVYGEEKVCLCHIAKPHNFLQFELLGFAKEWEHLRQPSDDQREKKTGDVKKLHQQGLSIRKIAEELKISVGSVHNYLKS